MARTQVEWKELYQRLVHEMKEDIPGFEVRYKDKTWHQKLVGYILYPFNKEYMVRYTSTFYPCVYFPTEGFVEADYENAFRTLSHEWVHLWDNKRSRFWFPTLYIMPQLLALLSIGAIGAIWSLWFLFFLVFLAALAPWTAPWRRNSEIRGYTMTMAVRYWLQGKIAESTKENIVGIFTGWGYYRMDGNADRVRKKLDERIELIESGKVLEEEHGPYYKVHQFLK